MTASAHTLHLENHRTLVSLYGESYTWGAVAFSAIVDPVDVDGNAAWDEGSPTRGFMLLVEKETFGGSFPKENDRITNGADSSAYRVLQSVFARAGWPLVEILVEPIQ